AVRAGLGVGGGAGDHVIQTASGLADAEQEHVSTRVDHQLRQAGPGGGGAGGREAPGLVRYVKQPAARGTAVFEVDPDGPGVDHRANGGRHRVRLAAVAAFDVGGDRQVDRGGDTGDHAGHLRR